MIETSTGVLHSFIETVNSTLEDHDKQALSRGQSAGLTVVVLITATVFSKFGIIDLIAKWYDTMSYGLMVVYTLPLLTLGVYKIWKATKVKDNVVEEAAGDVNPDLV